MLTKLAYLVGCRAALTKLGMGEQEQDTDVSPKPDDYPQEQPPVESASPEASDGEPSPEDLQALQQLLMSDPELLQMLQQQAQAPGGLTADMFTQFAQGDDTADVADPNAMPSDKEDEEHGPNWSGDASMSAGDAASRSHQMGVPSAGPV